MVEMSALKPNQDTLIRAGWNAAGAAVATALLFGAGKYVQQIPTASLNSMLSSGALSALAATGAQGAYSAYVGDKEKENFLFKTALTALAVVGANVAPTFNPLKGKVSFLEGNLNTAGILSGVQAAGVALASYVSTPKPAYKDGVAGLNTLADAIVDARNALEAETDDSKKAELKGKVDAAVKAFDAVKSNFTLSEAEAKAFEAIKKNTNVFPEVKKD